MKKRIVCVFNATAQAVRSRVGRQFKNAWGLSAVAAIALVGHVHCATISNGPTAPATNAFVIANLAATVTGGTKWYTDVGAIGQTFLTGSRESVLSAVTLKTTTALLPETRYIIRIGTVSGTAFTVVASETATQTVAWAANDYVTYTLNTPVLLAANTLYGFDIGLTYSSLGYYDGGIPYMAYSDTCSVC